MTVGWLIQRQCIVIMCGTIWNLNCYVDLNELAPDWACVTIKKVKVKFILEQATKAHRGSRRIALLFP